VVPSDSFWDAADHLLATSELVVERPLGSRHPRFDDIVYPLDYGHLTNTTGGDGAEVDMWLGSLPGAQRIVGACMTIDRHKRDAEVTLLVHCSPEEVAVIVAFFESNNVGVVHIARPHLE
jgi:inorganic pyrophosphatase